MSRELWANVDRYFESRLLPADAGLDAALAAADAAAIPAMNVSAAQGMLLELLARMVGARKILEIGTLGGYSAIWMARALPPGGSLTTLELDRVYAHKRAWRARTERPHRRRTHRVTATAIQTVGVKGYDGFILARVN